MNLVVRVFKTYVSDAFLLGGASLVSYGVYLFDNRLGLMCMGAFCLVAGVLIAKGER